MTARVHNRGGSRMLESDQDESFRQVIDAAVDGQDWAFTELYRQYAGRLCAFARARRAADPEAVANDAMLRAFQNISTFQGTSSGFESWLFTITRNRLVDLHRMETRRPEIADAEPSEDVTVDSAETAALGRLDLDDTLALLDSLTADQREVVALRMVADLSLEQVSAIVDKPVTAVKALQRRGLQRLQKEILGNPSPDHEFGRSSE